MEESAKNLSELDSTDPTPDQHPGNELPETPALDSDHPEPDLTSENDTPPISQPEPEEDFR